MALLFLSGFELKSTTDAVEFTTNNVGATIDTIAPRSGTYHGRCTAGNGFWRQVVYTLNQTKIGYNSVAVRIASAVNATTQLVRFSNTANALQATISLKTDNTLVLLKADGTQIGSASTALSTGVWYYVELKNDASGTGALDARINGVSFASGANSVAGTWARALIGTVTGVQTTADIYFDDWVVNDSDTGGIFDSWSGGSTGQNQLAIVRPNGNGETTSWTIGGSSPAATNWEGVSEVTPDDGTTLNSEAILNKEDLYTIASSGLTSGVTVNVVAVGCRFSNDTADATTAFQFEIEKANAGTKSKSASIIPNSTTWRTNSIATPDTYALVKYLDPDGTAWVGGDTLDTMRIGMIAGLVGTNKIQVTAIWAYIHYTPATSGNVPFTNSSLKALLQMRVGT